MAEREEARLAVGTAILIDADQIDGFISGTSSDLDNMTLGYGMSFLHELDHTSLGSGHKDDKSDFGRTGKVVDRMNKIRSELGSSYGQRTSYKSRTFSKSRVPVYTF